MDEIRFEELPPSHVGKGGHGQNKHAANARQLRARPGAWAVIGVYDKAGTAGSIAYAVKNGTMGPYRPAGTFEAASRKVDGEYRCYARYVGEAEHA